MKKNLLSLCLLAMTICGTFIASAQSGTYTTIAGNGATGIPNFSGPATSSPIGTPHIMTTDGSGNVYVGAEHIIYKVDPSGSITRIVGDGTESWATIPDEDGIPATDAHVYVPTSMFLDRAGNFYYADNDIGVLRKIDPSGTLTAYNASPLMGGSTWIGCAAADTAGNIYYSGGHSIMKIDLAGATTVFAGTGVAGFSGDGGPALAALFNGIQSIAFDNRGNMLVADGYNFRIRKITPSGIISTIAGNGINAISGDGGYANAAAIGLITNIHFDAQYNMYLTYAFGGVSPRKINQAGIITSPAFLTGKKDMAADNAGNFYFTTPNTFEYLTKYTPAATFASGFYGITITHNCSGPLVNVTSSIYDTNYRVVTKYGDGFTDTTRFSLGYFGSGSFSLSSHNYLLAGSYTIKSTLINGVAALDSFTTSYMHLPCDVIHVRPYADLNSNCMFDSSSDVVLSSPMRIEVDSNGVAKDTLSVTGGFYYTAYGNAGDVYSFRVLYNLPGLTPSCPTGGVISDTFSIYGDNSRNLDLGFNFSTVSGFDMNMSASHRAGRHTQQLTIAVNNIYATATTGALTVNISPKYNYNSAVPAPTLVSGHTLTWNLGSLSCMSGTPVINLSLEVPGTWLLPGDTVHTTLSVSPLAGDLDTSNNTLFIIDTVRSSYDPNYIAVAPEGNILNGTKLQYTIEFENDGNDTAHNIYVMDTLSDNVDPSSFAMVMATNTMNIVKFTSGGHTIVKFDFPNIKLLDSSHHNQCTGMLMYTVNAKTGLADNTNLFNHAGIFFDDNPVVMTNTVQNIIRLPGISIAQDATVCHGDTIRISATDPVINNTHYRWTVNGVAISNDKAHFSSAILNDGDMVQCKLWDGTGDSLLATSNTINIISLPAPNAGTITGAATVCVDATTTLSNAAIGGTWTSSTSSATIIGGVVSGVTAGSTVVSYTVTNSCGTAVDTMMVTVNPLPDAGVITGTPIVCATAATTLGNIVTGGTWTSSTSSATVSGGVVSGATAGSSIISYSVTNSCGTAVDTMMVTVNPLPDAGTITGAATVCAAANITLSNLATGGTWTSSAASATVAGGVVSGVTAGNTIISYSVTNSCGTAADTMMVTVNPLPVAGVITGATNVCIGTTITLSDTATGGIWAASIPAATVAGGVVTGVSAGIVVIFYTVTNSCGNASDTMAVTVVAPADAGTITGATSVCVGAATSLATTATGGTWSSSGATATVNTSGVVSGTTAGSATISYIVTNSCGTDTAVSSMTVNALPDAGSITGVDSVCMGEVITLSDAATGVWSSANSGIATVSTTGVVTGVNSGGVGIVYTATNSCGTDTATKLVWVRNAADCNTGISNTSTQTINIGIYPNPNNGTFTLAGTWPTADGKEVTVEIVNMLGQVVYKNNFNNNGIINEQIQAGNTLAAGTYVLTLHSNGERKMFHFVVKG